MAHRDRRAPAIRGRGRWWRGGLARLLVGLLFPLLVLGAVGGCGPEADSPPAVQGRAVPTYSDPSLYRVSRSQLAKIVDQLDPDSPQRAILADAHVTLAEVERAWEGYVTCLRGAGFTVTTSAWDPVTGTTRIFTYARAGATSSTAPPTTAPSTTTPPTTTRPTVDALSSAEAERVDRCEEQYWFPVSAVYAADTPPRMDPRLASAVSACMVGRGYPVQGVTDFGGMVGAVRGQARGERVQAGRDCLAQALPRLFPDLAYYPRP